MGKGKRARWVATWALGASLALPTGCLKPSTEASQRLQRVRQEGAKMDAAFDSLEERMLGNSANLAMWNEMARRHQSVSQIACENLDEHLRDMARNLERQQNKEAALKRRLASASGVRGGFATSSKLRE